MAVRQMAKGDYSIVIAMIETNPKDTSLEYVREYVNEVYKLRGMEITANRKCSDTNNTFYFITSFLLRFLKDSFRQLTSRHIKLEEETTKEKLEAIERGIEMLESRKSHYSLTQIVLDRTLKDFVRQEYFETKKFLLKVLTYEKITSLTVKNIIDKYD